MENQSTLNFVSSRCYSSLRLALITFCLFCLVGCTEKTLLQDLSQEQAQAIVSALLEQGITADLEKDKGSKVAYRVKIAEKNYSEAMSLVSKLGLPGESRESLTSLIATQGFFPNSRALENLRLERAQAAEIEEALRGNPGVLEVRAIVRNGTPAVQSMNPMPVERSIPTVALVIAKRPDVQLERSEVLALVRAALPGVEESGVTIMMHDALIKRFEITGIERAIDAVNIGIPLTSFMGIWRMPNDEQNRAALFIASGLLFAILTGFAAGYTLSSYRKRGSSSSRSFKKTELRISTSEPAERTEPPKLLNNGR